MTKTRDFENLSNSFGHAILMIPLCEIMGIYDMIVLRFYLGPYMYHK